MRYPNTEQVRAWDGADGQLWAAHADRFDRSMSGHHGALLAAARITPGDRVLNIGCGSGQTTRDAARQAAPGRVLGVDLSTAMLDEARRRAAAAGLSNAAFERADAQVHPFPAAGFDVALSRTGVMFFDDPPAAFGNIARALRPGARLALLTWQPAARNAWIKEIWAALTGRAGPPPADPGTPGPFALSDPARIRRLLAGTGFGRIELTARTAPMPLGSDPADAQRFVLELFGWLLREQPDPDRALARLRACLHSHHHPDGVRFASAAWLITAYR